MSAATPRIWVAAWTGRAYVDDGAKGGRDDSRPGQRRGRFANERVVLFVMAARTDDDRRRAITNGPTCDVEVGLAMMAAVVLTVFAKYTWVRKSPIIG